MTKMCQEQKLFSPFDINTSVTGPLRFKEEVTQCSGEKSVEEEEALSSDGAILLQDMRLFAE